MESGFPTTNPAAEFVRITSASADREPAPDELGRFEDLTKKLVNVPKGELDEKRREES